MLIVAGSPLPGVNYPGADLANRQRYAPAHFTGWPMRAGVVAWLKEVQNRKGNLWGSALHDAKSDPVILLLNDKARGVMVDSQSDVVKRKALAKKSGLAEVWVRTTEKAIKLSLIIEQ